MQRNGNNTVTKLDHAAEALKMVYKRILKNSGKKILDL